MKSIAESIRGIVTILLLSALVPCGIARPVSARPNGQSDADHSALSGSNGADRSPEFLAPATIFMWPGGVFLGSLPRESQNTPQAIRSADPGGDLFVMATESRAITDDLTSSIVVADASPRSNGLLGGFCRYTNNPVVTRPIWIRFNSLLSDSVTAVFFGWKLTADPNAPSYWHDIGQAILDDSSRRWAFAWNDTSIACGLISLRAHVWDNAVPVPHDTMVIFADSVRMDNCPPVIHITNVNGNPAPEHMNIGRGQAVHIVASVADAFGNGANSPIDSVAFYYSRVSFDTDVPGDWTRIGRDTNGAPWQTNWNTSALLPGVLLIHAVAWDHAGNCGEVAIDVTLVDVYPQRAWIVGLSQDSLVGCADRLWAVTRDGPTNRTMRVGFDYTTDSARTWIHLGETTANTPYCDANLVINTWSWSFELDSIPQNAIFRAVGTDSNNNYDQNPPRFLRTDVFPSGSPGIFDEDWARIQVTPGQLSWLFGMLKGSVPTCLVNGALVCAAPGYDGSSQLAGGLDSLTRPCFLNNSDGIVTVFRAVQTHRDSAQYVELTTYQLAVHPITANGGSNGLLISEDRQAEVTIPHDGTAGDGTMWFEPAQDTARMVPPSQPFLHLLSMIENVMSKDIASGTQPSVFRMYFNATTLPANDTMVVVEYWDHNLQLWQLRGITVERRHFDRIHADSSFVDFSLIPNWRVSSSHPGCPGKVRLGVFHTSIRPISAYVHFASTTCPGIPDSTYYGLDTNGVRTDCRSVYWVMVNNAGQPNWNAVDVYIDTIRVVENGIPVTNAFEVRTDTVSGTISVFFSPRADTVSPWFGCLRVGRHTVQFLVDNQHTAVTPFTVDVTGPDAHATPTYFAHTARISAELEDMESGVDTTAVEAHLRNCGNPSDPRFVRVGPEGMSFAVLPNERGYRAAFSVQWEQVQFMFPDTLPRPADQLCVTWRVANKVCLRNDSTTYVYTVDVMPPTVTPIAPVGPGGAEDSITYGARPTIEAFLNDSARSGSGASGLDIGQLQLIIDNHAYTPADTANPALGFHIITPFNHRHADVRFGGAGSGPEVDPYYRPGEHRVTVIAPDSLGNIGGVSFGWNYFVRSSGPMITFDTTAHDCGVWFNPTVSDTFHFCVDSLAGVPIAPNGIQYSVYTVRNHERISGPTTVNPQNTAHECVAVTLAGAFPAGETGVEIAVDAWSMLYDPAVDSINGITHSRITYWADNYPPQVTSHVPATDSLLSQNERIDITVMFADNSPDSAVTSFSRNTDQLLGNLKTVGKTSDVRSRFPSRLSDRGRHGNLDDNGSGIAVQKTRMTIIPPNGVPIHIAPDSANHFLELDAAHARYILPQGQAPGNYSVSMYLEDCVGNIGGFSWAFRVRGLGPEIAFQAIPSGLPCQYGSYWSSNTPLYLRATVHERDSANVDANGIRVDLLRAYQCDSGICQDTLLRNAPFRIVGEQPDPHNTNQTFSVQDSFHLDPMTNATEVRILLTATDATHASASQIQSWVIDDTAPWITPVSPHPDGFVLQGQMVTISANYSDGSSLTVAAPPGGVAQRLLKRALERLGRHVARGKGLDSSAPAQKSVFHAASTLGLDDTEGNSGVDSTCVTLHLRSHTDGSERDLTAHATRTASTITWADTLALGVYTAIVSACDKVCNLSRVNWDFTVAIEIPASDTIAPTISLISPPNGSALPYHATPTFVVRVMDAPGGEIDSSSISLRLETINSLPVPGTLTVAVEGNRRTATASLAVGALSLGDYILYAQAMDTASNRADAAFQYSVRDTIFGPGEPQLGDSSAYNYPNPFSMLPNEGGGMTRFSVPATGGAYVQIKIYDFSGMFVATIFDRVLPQTGYEPVWRAQNEHGELVASGVYLAHIRMSAGGATKEQIVKVAFRNKK